MFGGTGSNWEFVRWRRRRSGSGPEKRCRNTESCGIRDVTGQHRRHRRPSSHQRRADFKLPVSFAARSPSPHAPDQHLNHCCVMNHKHNVLCREAALGGLMLNYNSNNCLRWTFHSLLESAPPAPAPQHLCGQVDLHKGKQLFLKNLNVCRKQTQDFSFRRFSVHSR